MTPSVLFQRLTLACLAAGLGMPLAQAQTAAPMPHDMAQHGMPQHAMPPAAVTQQAAPKADDRKAVHFPAAAKRATLAEMRAHLQALGDIQMALSRNEYELAARLAENKLGLSSMHGDMYDSARYMPAGMRELGYAMHQSASQFAVIAQDASVSGDLRPAIAALAKVNQNCVACHAAYKLK
ncbi:hypothetical protein [Thiomonas intermedia]|uniref:hypothetical protein n=1 Tax=Thiomonas intermedia TaxID=926 RepID=UPI0012AB4FAF|nr:hypothetical protein [Thiomonas intermedia]